MRPSLGEIGLFHHTTRNYSRQRLVLLLIAGLCQVILIGCGKATPVENGDALAHGVITQCLNAWTDGKKPDELRTMEPAIVVVDEDWKAGRHLIDFEMVGKGLFDGRNLRIPVSLILQDARGRKQTITASYVIGVDPAITVVRQMD